MTVAGSSSQPSDWLTELEITILGQTAAASA